MLSPHQLSVQARPTSSFQGRGSEGNVIKIIKKKKKAENKDQEVYSLF